LSKKQTPFRKQNTVTSDEDRLSFNEDDFLNDLENDQEIIYEDDDLSQEYLDEVPALTKDIGKPKETFPNKALLRQVNYVQEMPINIDYSKFDKLALIQQTA
jgi:hypothetical protein